MFLFFIFVFFWWMGQGVEGDKPYKQFLVVKPHLTDDQCHPEEHLFPKVTDEIWKSHMTEDGRIEDVFQLRKVNLRHSLLICIFMLQDFVFFMILSLKEIFTNFLKYFFIGIKKFYLMLSNYVLFGFIILDVKFF